MAQSPHLKEDNIFHLNNPLKRAGFGIRLIAYLIDRAVLFMIEILFILGAIVISVNTGDNIPTNLLDFNFLQTLNMRFSVILLPLYIAITVIKMGYFTYFIGSTGQTIGKMIVGITVVSSDEKVMNYSRATLRWIGYIASSVPLYMGFLWIIFDDNNEAWHDKIAGTCVVTDF